MKRQINFAWESVTSESYIAGTNVAPGYLTHIAFILHLPLFTVHSLFSVGENIFNKLQNVR